jgi:hypothetical protein
MLCIQRTNNSPRQGIAANKATTQQNRSGLDDSIYFGRYPLSPKLLRDKSRAATSAVAATAII